VSAGIDGLIVDTRIPLFGWHPNDDIIVSGSGLVVKLGVLRRAGYRNTSRNTAAA
jgi:hypothetical protein